MNNDTLRVEAAQLAILFAKTGCASAAKAAIIKNDKEQWQSSNIIAKTAKEEYREMARYTAHLFGSANHLTEYLFLTSSPAQIARMNVAQKPKYAIQNYDWNEELIKNM